MRYVALLLTLLCLCSCGGGDLAGQRFSTHTFPMVMLGDSVTEEWMQQISWDFADWTSVPIIGAGCVQIADAFDAQTANAKAIHILCGTNDIYRYKNEWSMELVTGPLAEMIAKAHARNQIVIVGTVPPWGRGAMADHYDADLATHLQRLSEINQWIRKQPGLLVADYYSVLSGPDGYFLTKYTTNDDGAHPNAAGYAAMRAELDRVIDSTL